MSAAAAAAPSDAPSGFLTEEVGASDTTRRSLADEDEIHRAHLREEPPDAVGTKVHDLRIVGKVLTVSCFAARFARRRRRVR